MKKLISIALIFALFPYLTGCYSMNEISRTEFERENKDENIELQTVTDDVYRFEHSYYIQSDTLYGTGIKKTNKGAIPVKARIALNDILTVETEEFNKTETIVFFTILISIIIASIYGLSEEGNL